MARFSPENVQRARDTVARYPRTRSALIPLLHLAQEQDGWLTDDAMEHIAEILEIESAEVLGTASFYEMFKRERVGRYLIGVCTNISCLLLGGEELLEYAEEKLGIKAGGTTPDGAFTLEGMECLAACGGAPCLQVNYRYLENVTPEQFDSFIDQLQSGRLAETVPHHGVLSRTPPPQPVVAQAAPGEGR